VRRALLAAATATLAAAIAAPASAQVVAVRAPGHVVGALPLRPIGSLAVEWESDPATCEAVGRCGLSGVTTWRLPEDGSLYLFTTGRGARRAPGGFLSIGEVLGIAGSVASARVRRGAHVCVDSTAVNGFSELEGERDRLALGFGHDALGSALASRCPGPVLEDVEGAIPTVAVPFERLRRGRMRVRMQGDATFAAHGLRGRVRSTLVLRLGAPERERDDEERLDTGSPPVRLVTNRFRVAELRGEVALDVAGAGECVPLDSCGLSGTVRFVPRVTAGSAELVAVVPARLGRRAALASVGLAPGGARPGIGAFGAAYWAGPGLVAASVARPGDAVACRDSVSEPFGVVFLRARGTRVRATLQSVSSASGRTRCAGPSVGGRTLATATIPLRAFGRRRVEIALTEPAPLSDDGWSIAARPSLTVVLEHRDVVERPL
jgi:hypothetical protein